MAQQEELSLAPFEGLKVSTNNSEYPRFAYLGAGAKIDLMEEWLQLLRKLKIGPSSNYIDLTAGSCNQPYTIQKQLGSRIITNDAAYYSFLIGKTIIERSKASPDKFINKVLSEALANREPGRFCAFEPWKMDRKIKLFVDGLVSKLPYNKLKPNDALILASLGAAILSKLTFRSSGSMLAMGKKADGTAMTIEEFSEAVYRKIVRTNHFVGSRDDNLALLGSLDSAVIKLEKVLGTHWKNTVVNVDFAWPFRKGLGANPYNSYLRISKLLGAPPSDFQYWSDESEETVLEACAQMMIAILKRKPTRLFLWNQTTNAPHPDKVLSYLLKKGIDCRVCLKVDRSSISRQSTFTDIILEMKQ